MICQRLRVIPPLLFFLMGCAVAPVITPTAAPSAAIIPTANLTKIVTPIISPTRTTTRTVTRVLSPIAIFTSSPTPTLACQRETAAIALSASATTLKKGEVVTVTATLINQGCVALGLPQYRLYVQAERTEPIFDPDKPAPVVHQLAVAPGRSDATNFVLRAVGAGHATLRASVSFEVHLGYPGPAYWGSSSSESLVITVTPPPSAAIIEPGNEFSGSQIMPLRVVYQGKSPAGLGAVELLAQYGSAPQPIVISREDARGTTEKQVTFSWYAPHTGAVTLFARAVDKHGQVGESSRISGGIYPPARMPPTPTHWTPRPATRAP